MSETVYRFIPSNIPGQWAVFHRATGTRVPGLVTVKPDAVGDPRRFCYQRPVALPSDKKPKLFTISAGSVAELSDRLDKFFKKETS
jgi:hypothetical protein